MQLLGSLHKGFVSLQQFQLPSPQSSSPVHGPHPQGSRIALPHQHPCHSTPPASWRWGKHHGCGAVAILHSCPGAHLQNNVNTPPCVLHHCRHSSPAAQAPPSWRNNSFDPARIFQLERDLFPDEVGSSFHKAYGAGLHQSQHTDKLLFTSSEDWRDTFHAGQIDISLQQWHREFQTKIGWHKSRRESYSVDAVCDTKDLSLLLPTQNYQSDTYKITDVVENIWHIF